MNKNTYVGNCIDSFDEDGECVIYELPYSDTTDFAQALDDAASISYIDFLEQCEPIDITTSNLEYMQADDVIIAYDDNEDVHYFFV